MMYISSSMRLYGVWFLVVPQFGIFKQVYNFPQLGFMDLWSIYLSSQLV
jgi:hypothetical protein